METNGNEEVVCSHGEGEGGDGNYSLPSLPCLGREREMKEQKQSQHILIINPQHFKEEGNGKESHMWDVEENRKKRRLPSSNAALERGTPRLLVAFASRAWFHNPELNFITLELFVPWVNKQARGTMMVFQLTPLTPKSD